MLTIMIMIQLWFVWYLQDIRYAYDKIFAFRFPPKYFVTSVCNFRPRITICHLKLFGNVIGAPKHALHQLNVKHHIPIARRSHKVTEGQPRSAKAIEGRTRSPHAIPGQKSPNDTHASRQTLNWSKSSLTYPHQWPHSPVTCHDLASFLPSKVAQSMYKHNVEGLVRKAQVVYTL